MKCRNHCTEPARHWAWWRRSLTQHAVTPTCSSTCLFLLLERKTMTDPNEAEQAAIAHAADCAGQFIEEAGQTDMAQWTPDRWQAFIATICGGYVDSLLRQQAAAQTAIGKIQAA